MVPISRSDQVGSLLRPPSLLALRNQHGLTTSYSSTSSSSEVEAATHAAIAAVVQHQLTNAIHPITTGELDRQIFYGGFFESLSGFTTIPSLPLPDAFRPGFPTIRVLLSAGVTTRPGVVATGPIRHRGDPGAYGKGWDLLKSLVPAESLPLCKTTMPSPTWQHMQLREGTAYSADSGYGSDAEYFADVAAAFRDELRVLYEKGCRNVQVDDPNMTYFVIDEFLEGCEKGGDDNGGGNGGGGLVVDPDEMLAEYIRVHNMCLEGREKDMHVGIHLCRGNMWNEVTKRGAGQGSYEKIAERVFGGLDYDSFYLEYDDERSGGFEPLRFLPKGKVVVLGLVSTKRIELEDIGELEGRVKEAARVIAEGQGRSVEEVMEDSLAVSPQCGFASQSEGGGQGMTEERQWEKLALVRDLARRLWNDAA